jgi:hypothetical protein
MCNCKKPKVIVQQLPVIESQSNIKGVSNEEWSEVGELIKKSTLEYNELEFLTSVHNRIFDTNKPVTNCKSCVKRLVSNITDFYKNNIV